MATPGPYESYALKHRRLHPDCIAVLRPHFEPLGFDVASVSFCVTRHVGNIPMRGSRTAVAVLANTVYVQPGTLDADGIIRRNLWSWRQPRGVALWAHEVYHVYQWQKGRMRFLWGGVTGLLMSWARFRGYDHERFWFEREARAFERNVRDALRSA